jgi:MFS family permease
VSEGTGPASPAPRGAWNAAFRHRDFRLFLGARFASVVGMQMQSVAIGWQVYSITGRPMSLAWVGLAQFFPVAGLSLLAGQVADRFPRRKILMVCQGAMAALSAALFLVAHAGVTHVAPIYAVLVGIGVARAFLGPANQSILPSLVPVQDFGNAVAWGSSSWQVATVLGPTLGGVLYAAFGGAAGVYSAASCCGLGALALITGMSGRPAAASRLRSAGSRSSILDGVRYVRSNPIVLGAISLDLFAVLLGGATALLPVYARDILHLGPWALGALRSAPAAGAAVTAIVLALRPIERRAGAKMFAGVAAFGAATIVFGVSRSFVVSLIALIVLGASDMVSVFVRSALVQLATPDAMRGRVSAVNMVFIGASNELGEFESGLTAAWLGTVPSVVLGGLGTLAVVALWMWAFPPLRRIDRLDDATRAA